LLRLLISISPRDLEDNKLSGEADGAFDGLANLVTLKLGKNQLTEIPTRALAGLTSLQGLSLSQNSIGEINENAFRVCAVRHRSGLAPVTNKRSCCMQGLPQLGGIYISQNRISSIANGAFKGKSIRNLYVSGHGRQELYFFKENMACQPLAAAFTPMASLTSMNLIRAIFKNAQDSTK
jgi:Leucine-rich repeat (LRR) protein